MTTKKEDKKNYEDFLDGLIEARKETADKMVKEVESKKIDDLVLNIKPIEKFSVRYGFGFLNPSYNGVITP